MSLDGHAAPNQVRKTVEDLAQVAACLTLNYDCGDKHFEIQAVDAVLHVHQGSLDIYAEPLLIVKTCKLSTERIYHLLADELCSRLERIPCLHCTYEHVDRIGQLLAEHLQPLFLLSLEPQPRGDPAKDRNA